MSNAPAHAQKQPATSHIPNHNINITTAVMTGSTDWEKILQKDLELSSDNDEPPTKISIGTLTEVTAQPDKSKSCIFIYLFEVLRRFQHCTGHIMTGSWKGRGNQYIQFVRVLYCKLPTNGKQLPAFPLEAMPGIEPRPQRWEARVLPLCHRGPQQKL